MVKIGEKVVGGESPVYVIAEIGINHNGDIDIAKKLIDVAVEAGCDAVKFQKRNPDACVPESQKKIMRETPWGYISYLEYKYKIEFNKEQFDEIDRYCKLKKIDWFASCWDLDSVEFISQYNIVAYKIASASLTDEKLLRRIHGEKKPIILSTGMSTIEEVENAIGLLNRSNLCLLHAVSTYPAPVEELNLRVISEYQKSFPDLVIGYSGHEVGLATTYAALALGAKVIERHITLDRAMWGTDQRASVEPHGLKMLVHHLREIEKSLGDGKKTVSKSELPIRDKLRK